jgi:hypothetical protein
MAIRGTASVLLRLNTYTTLLKAQITDLSDYDLMLGLAWLRKTNPKINFKTLQINIRDRRCSPSFTPLATYPTLASDGYYSTLELNLVSYHARKKSLLRETADPPISHLLVI